MNVEHAKIIVITYNEQNVNSKIVALKRITTSLNTSLDDHITGIYN